MIHFLFQILFDFDLMYTNADSNALLNDIWANTILKNLYNLFEEGINGCNYPINDASFLDLLYLIRAMPSARYKFDTSVSNFIKISKVMLFAIALLYAMS